MLRTAINLKDAINKAPYALSSLGICYSIEREWNIDKGLEEKESSDEENAESLDRFINFIKNEKVDKRIHTFSQSFFESEELDEWNFSINLGNSETNYSGPLSGITVELLYGLYKHAPEATFGNLKEMTTDINPEVRSARDITSEYFQVDSKMLEKIARIWKVDFDYEGEVRVEPYKVNLYGPDGCFREHRDTPSKNLVGTFLVGLGDTSMGACLQVSDLDFPSYKRIWKRTELGSWCAFYPDLIHEVTKVTSGLRANLSFKIFVKDTVDPNDVVDPVIRKRWEALPSSVKEKPFGIILSHDYSLNSDTLKGTDKLYLETFEGLGLRTEIIPVVVKFSGTYNYDYPEKTECSSGVYPITEETLKYLLGEEQSTTNLKGLLVYDLKDSITFYSHAKGYEWYSDDTPYCEFTGNECQPGEEDSLYLHRAVIVYPK